MESVEGMELGWGVIKEGWVKADEEDDVFCLLFKLATLQSASASHVMALK